MTIFLSSMLARLTAILMVSTGLLPATVTPRHLHLPMVFEANRGQADQQVAFLSHGNGYAVQFDRKGIALVDGQTTVRMDRQDASPAGSIRGYNPQAGKANYLKGRQSQWLTNIQLYGGVFYEEIYPGISLLFHGTDGELEYDLSLSPSARPSAIRLLFTGV